MQSELQIPISTNPSRSRIRTIRKNLLSWYAANKRALPWRRDDDPYRIWVSEIMLQQTRVDQAVPYFDRFVAEFPDAASLAKRDIDSVLKLWEGLGYYSRARNLHAAARIVHEELGGYLPRNAASLRKLPGIGSYTAGAIASIAFNERTPAVDGNVLRVLARLFLIDVDIKDAKARRNLNPLATLLVDPVEPGEFNQALMELGATICTPTNPSCQHCPLARVCEARKAGKTDSYPRRVVRPRIPIKRQVAVVAIDEAGRVALQRRPESGMLGGLWEFPTFDDAPANVQPSDIATLIANVPWIHQSAPPRPIGSVKHAYSHFKIDVAVFVVSVSAASGPPKGPKWLVPDRISELALAGITTKIVKRLRSELSV